MTPKVQDDRLGSFRYESLVLSKPKRKDLENVRMDVIRSSLKRLTDERVERHYRFSLFFFELGRVARSGRRSGRSSN